LGDDYAAISTDAFLQAAFGASLLFTPGTDYAYSNVGYSILGIILERITGQSYSDFLIENIFRPAGMTTAGYHRDGVDYSLLTHGYRANGDDWGTSHDKAWNGPEPWWHLKANGGLLMCPRDMYQWYLALRGSMILKPETLALQIAPHVPEGGDTWYGYGYAVTPDGRRVEHNGSNGIFKADFRWFPKEDLFIYATSNDADVKLFRTCDEVLEILRTGILPQAENWIMFEPHTALDTGRMNTALAFAALIQAYTPEGADAFVGRHCTPELVERNGMDRLHELFGMLHGDIGQGGPSAVYADADRFKLTLPGARDDFRVHLLLTFRDDRIDRIGAELEGK
jgi:CubicO group peptidase (beta-lactamase class C family)